MPYKPENLSSGGDGGYVPDAAGQMVLKDECAKWAMGLLADHHAQAEILYGGAVVNTDFSPSWTRNLNPSLQPTGVYKVGIGDFDGRHESFYAQVLDRGHIAFPGTEEGIDMLRGLMLRLQGDVEPGDMRITVCDFGLGELFADFANLGDLYRHVSGNDRLKLLREVEAIALQRINGLMKGRTLREMSGDPKALESGHRPAPFEVVALVGNGQPLTRDEEEVFQRLLPRAADAGINFLICDIPMDHDPAYTTDVGAQRFAVLPERVSASAALVTRTAKDIVDARTAPKESPSALYPEHIWEQSARNGIAVPIGVDEQEQPVNLEINDAAPAYLIVGPQGAGKSTLARLIELQIALRYPPTEVKMIHLDCKGEGGNEGRLWGPIANDPNSAPSFDMVADNVDPVFAGAVLDDVVKELNRRIAIFTEAGASKVGDYRLTENAQPMPRLVVFVDEFQRLLAERSSFDPKEDILNTMLRILREGRAAGIHLLLATQVLPNDDPTKMARIGTLRELLPGRLAMAQSRGALNDGTNKVADTLPRHHVVVNTTKGERTPDQRVVRFPDTPPSEIRRGIARIAEAGYPTSNRPIKIYDGQRAPSLAADLEEVKPLTGGPARVIIGKGTDVKEAPIQVSLSRSSGRNILVYGPNTGDIVDTAVASLGKQFPPGMPDAPVFRVVCASDEPTVVDQARATYEMLRSSGHRVFGFSRDQAAGAFTRAANAISDRRPGKEFLIVHGVDGGTGEYAALQKVMKDGPSQEKFSIVSAASPKRLLDSIKSGGSLLGPDIRDLSEVWVSSGLPVTELAAHFGGNTVTAEVNLPRNLLSMPGRLIVVDSRHNLGRVQFGRVYDA